MNLVGVAIVRNEADVVEAFVRHYLDRLVVIDHQSDDATPALLAALRDEGLPLTLRRFEDLACDHARRMTEALRLAAELHAADAYLTLDADEFLRCGSPSALREAVAAVP
ncbi:MAG: glycosyltransferase family 2 protein, partial [Pseudomonadota bacterium]